MQPRTHAMIKAAARGKRLNLKGGTEYALPRKSPAVYRKASGGEKMKDARPTPTTNDANTRFQALDTPNSPAARGRKGLLILSTFTS
mmetsp:Transcript_112650/g.273562  ORF Transcript_112650/g.273562 Transcript_112650/m.273562 type:complete len:87 (-) Transcript_112650:253-513(-)